MAAIADVIAPFLWKNGQAVTKAEVDRQRKLADSLRAPEGYVPEGWASLVGGLAKEGVAAYRDNQASEAEDAAQKKLADALANGDYMSVLGDSFATPQQSAVASALWQQEQQNSDPLRQLQIDEAKLKLEQMRNPPPKTLDFGDTSSVRKEVQGLTSYKNLANATPIYKSMADTANRDTRASDLNLVYGLGKIMDPTSVVREGEMFMVQGINTLPSKLVEGINSVLTGQSSLSPEARKQIMDEAYSRIASYKSAYDADAQMYRDIAGRYNINPADILPQFGEYKAWEPAGPVTPGAKPGAPTPGTVVDGYRFKGGDPNDPTNWEPVA